MNVEEERLRSFSLWPDNAPVSPQQLAEKGFYATGRFLEAECYWCHCRINDWEYGDRIDERHRFINPQCEFLLNRLSCGNVCSSGEHDNASAANSNDLMLESNRLATFKNWPNPNISPESLAKAGFFYLNRSDEVKCVWCKAVIAQWEKNDNAFNEHRRFFPDCPRVQLGPLIEMASDSLRDLEIQQVTPPKNPKYLTLEARLRTYTKWPIPNIQKPADLAQAGLYYQEVDDQVRCFHCNIGLRSWEKEDDPWFEHAKWYPQCQFVRLVRGNNYVQQVLELMRQSVPQQQQEAISCPMSIDEAMCTIPARQALEMGIDVGALRRKLQQQLNVTGRPYSTVEDLIKAVFDDQDADNYSGYLSDDSNATTDNTSNARNEPNISTRATRDRGENHSVEITSATSHHNALNSVNIKAEASSSSAAAASASSLSSSSTSSFPVNGNGKAQTNKGQLSTTRDACERKLSSTTATTIITTSTNSQQQQQITLEEENRKLKEARLCKVCMDEEVGVVYLPCGHLVTCVQCAPGVEKCPMCRTTIKGFVRTFLS